MDIRAARPEEFEALGRITVKAYQQVVDGEPLGSYEDQLLAVADRAADSVVLVAVDADGELLGGVTYVPDAGRAMSEFDDPDAAGIRMLAVRPDRQGAGVGRALTTACIERARAEGRPRVVLHSTDFMTVARGMYARMGFVEAPQLDLWVSRADGEEPTLRLIAFVLVL
jgi:predicted N-acetyltransferase YhbS